MKKWERIEFCTGKGAGGGFGCNRKIFIQEEDLFRITHLKTEEKAITFQCPYCGVQTEVDPSKVPKEIRDKILKS